MSETLKKLQILKSILIHAYSRNVWSYHMLINELYVNDKVSFESGEYNCGWTYEWDKKNRNLQEDLKKDLREDGKEWRTYDSCVDFELFIEEDIIKAKIQVWEGDNLHGVRTITRWQAVFSGISVEELDKFQDAIDWKFDDHVKGLFRKEEEERKKKRIKEIEENLLKNENFN